MNDNQFGVLLEDIDQKMGVVVEAVGQIQDQIKVLPTMQSNLQQLKDDVQTIKQVVTEQQSEINQLKAA